jgi:hypothetical protein
MSSALCSQTTSIDVIFLGWQEKFHSHTKEQVVIILYILIFTLWVVDGNELHFDIFSSLRQDCEFPSMDRDFPRQSTQNITKPELRRRKRGREDEGWNWNKDGFGFFPYALSFGCLPLPPRIRACWPTLVCICNGQWNPEIFCYICFLIWERLVLGFSLKLTAVLHIAPVFELACFWKQASVNFDSNYDERDKGRPVHTLRTASTSPRHQERCTDDRATTVSTLYVICTKFNCKNIGLG